jgi:hypothetical protein
MLEITNEEKEILKREIEILCERPEGNHKTNIQFEELLNSINGQKIDEPQLSVLSHVLELLLASGEIRKKYSPIEEQKIFRLYGRTPIGKELKENIDELNNSLKALQAQKIEDISFSLKLPGIYGISIKTDKCELSLNASQFGVYADKLEFEI